MVIMDSMIKAHMTFAGLTANFDAISDVVIQQQRLVSRLISEMDSLDDGEEVDVQTRLKLILNRLTSVSQAVSDIANDAQTAMVELEALGYGK